MKLTIDKRYLALPVSTHAQRKKLYFRDAKGQPLYDLDIRLDPVGSQFVYYADISVSTEKNWISAASRKWRASIS